MSQDGMPLYRSTWSAPIVGVVTTVQLTGETIKGVGLLLWNLVSGVAKQVNLDADVREEGAASLEAAGNSVAGPVGIIGYIFPAFASTGLTNLAYLAAIISISLAVMNILPIPALDGGRWLLITTFRLRRKELTTEIEERIVGRAFMVLIGLIVIITVLDVTRFFK
jgi:regulator of sigma E protease